jgi:hypothetical protein
MCVAVLVDGSEAAGGELFGDRPSAGHALNPRLHSPHMCVCVWLCVWQFWSMGVRRLVESSSETVLLRDMLGPVSQALAAPTKNPVYLLNLPGTFRLWHERLSGYSSRPRKRSSHECNDLWTQCCDWPTAAIRFQFFSAIFRCNTKKTPPPSPIGKLK